MATLYVNFKSDPQSPGATDHEKLALTGTAAVTTGASRGFGTVELYTDTVCEVSVGSGITDTTKSPFYVGPGIRYLFSCGDGCKVAAKTA